VAATDARQRRVEHLRRRVVDTPVGGDEVPPRLGVPVRGADLARLADDAVDRVLEVLADVVVVVLLLLLVPVALRGEGRVGPDEERLVGRGVVGDLLEGLVVEHGVGQLLARHGVLARGEPVGGVVGEGGDPVAEAAAEGVGGLVDGVGGVLGGSLDVLRICPLSAMRFFLSFLSRRASMLGVKG